MAEIPTLYNAITEHGKELFKALYTSTDKQALEIIYRYKASYRLYIAVYLRRGYIVNKLINDKALAIDSKNHLLCVFADVSILNMVFNEEIYNNSIIKRIVKYYEHICKYSLHSSVFIIILRELLRGNKEFSNDYLLYLVEEIKKEEVYITQILLESNIAYVNQPDNKGNVPLYFATKKGHLDMIELLLNNGADPNAESILDNAIIYGKLRIVKTIVSYMETKFIKNSKAICTAAKMKNIDILSFLLQKGFDVNAKDEYGDSPLHCIVCSYMCIYNLLIAELLISNGANINARNKVNFTPLHAIAEYCNKNYKEYINYEHLTRYFVDAGADLEAKDSIGQTPIYLTYNVPKMVKLFIELGANVCSIDNNGLTPLENMLFTNFTMDLLNLYSIRYIISKIVLISFEQKIITDTGLLKNINTINDNPNTKIIAEECREELLRMKSTKINDDYSLIDILFMKVNSNNKPDIVDENLLSYFPIYNNYIKKSLSLLN